MQSDKRIQKMPTECTVWLLSHDVWFPTRKSDDSGDAWMYWSPLRISKGLLCVHMYYIMRYYVHQKWTVYSLYIDCWEVPRPMRPQRQTQPAPERCWFLLWCICFTKLKTIQTVCSLASLDTEAMNSQEDLAERSNISEYFFRRKPASLSVSSCQEATSTPCSTQTLDCASGSGTQRMLRHDCMVATCLPRGGFAKSVWAWCPGV